MADEVDASSELSKIAKLNGDFRRKERISAHSCICALSVPSAAAPGFGAAWSRWLFLLALAGWRGMAGRCQRGFDRFK
jgi:hypothetical protein